MTAPREPFVSQLRARGEPLVMATPGGPSITVRVEMPETWDTLKAVVSPDEPIVGLKVRALELLNPMSEFHDEYMFKLRGWEVLDENASIAACGAVDGSIFLLTYRKRRPVR